MERKDLLLANAQIFSAQGKALNEVADRKLRVLVVGNPANTNALIASRNAPDLDARNFTAMTRLDHNRALSQLAEKTGSHVNDIRKLTIWGNHSSTQYPDISHATVQGKPARELVDQKWIERQHSFRPCSSAAPRSSRRAARHRPPRPPRRRSTMCAPGCSARRRRLDQHGRAVGRQLWHQGRHHLLVSGHLHRRQLPDRAGTGDR